MKKIIAFLCLSILIKTTSGQGLDSVFVEKIPVHADAIAADPNLNPNSKTYRVFIDMAQGYRLSDITGRAQNPVYFKTSTQFYNDYDGDVYPVFSPIPAITNPLYYDSWLTIGSYGKAAARTQIVPLSEDTDGNVNGFMGPAATILTALDPATNLEPFFGYEMGSNADGSVAGWDPENLSWYTAGGLPGIGPSNSVCIGQFTTDGNFSMEISVQLVSDKPQPEVYVLRVADPGNNQQNSNWMVYPNTPPSVTLTSPASGQSFGIGEIVPMSAEATDPDGSISKVVFIVNGYEVGSDTQSPYTFSWSMGQTDINKVIAIAFDDKLARDSSFVTISQNSSPTISISNPVNGAEYTTGEVVSLAATATDTDGSIAKVEFFLNGLKVGEDTSSPFGINWTAIAGIQELTATATDNLGASNTSDVISFNVVTPGNTSPIISITSPTQGTLITSGSQLLITASSSDPDPSDFITKLEFLVNNVVVHEDTQAPFEYQWTSTGSGEVKLTAKSYDNNGGSTLSSEVTINLNIPPVITPTSPAEGSMFKLNQTILLSADATDSDGIKKVEFFVDDILVGEATSSPFQFNWTANSIGNKSIRMVATDNLNGAKSTNPLNISVDFPDGVVISPTSFSLNIYPNPMSDYFIIETNSINSYTYSVSDITGKKILSGKVDSEKDSLQQKVDLSNFPNGLYLIQVVSTDGSYKSVKKVIKSRL